MNHLRLDNHPLAYGKLPSIELLNSLFFRNFPSVPLAMPFWNGETYRNILRCLLSGRIIDGGDGAALHGELLEYCGAADAVLCDSASSALELGLRTCQLGEGDEVVIPTFCCSAVVPPILAVGATPVLADVGVELNLTVETVAAALTRKSRAIIVPHLFGNPADIAAITGLANRKNIVVIDDAAQALGATIDGQSAASFGDMGVISFGAEKICFGLGGGALISHSCAVAEAARQTSLSRPRVATTLAKLLSTLLWRSWRMLALRRQISPEALPEPYRRENLANLNAAVARSLLHSLADNLQARRARVQAYEQLLGKHAGIELIRHRPGSACLTQVIRLLPKRRGDDPAARLIAALGQAGYEVQGSYMPIHLLARFPQCVWDSLPYAERMWRDLVELPCEPTVSLAEVERIAAIVKDRVEK